MHKLDANEYTFEDVKGSTTTYFVKREWNKNVYGLEGIEFSPGDIVLDIGGHVGVISTLLGKLHPSINIISYEASPAHAELFKKNLKTNKVDNVSVNCAAVEGHSGETVTLSYCGEGNSGNMSKFHKTDTSLFCSSISISFDDIIKKHGIEKIKFLKVDCEGSEYEIFYASKYFRPEFVEYVAIEFHNRRELQEMGFSPEKLYQDMLDLWGDKLIVANNVNQCWI
mgnify:CR=1 FL=1